MKIRDRDKYLMHKLEQERIKNERMQVNQFKRFVRNLHLGRNTIEKKHCFPSDQQIRKIAVNDMQGLGRSNDYNLKLTGHVQPERNVNNFRPRVIFL